MIFLKTEDYLLVTFSTWETAATVRTYTFGGLQIAHYLVGSPAKSPGLDLKLSEVFGSSCFLILLHLEPRMLSATVHFCVELSIHCRFFGAQSILHDKTFKRKVLGFPWNRALQLETQASIYIWQLYNTGNSEQNIYGQIIWLKQLYFFSVINILSMIKFIILSTRRIFGKKNKKQKTEDEQLYKSRNT